MDTELSPEDKRILCSIAREAIASRLFHGEHQSTEAAGTLRRGGGAFVTLHENGELRGCIGRMQSEMPLAETVRNMAEAAAFEDPRFDPLTRAEFPDIDIEITVLGPMRSIRGEDEVIVGKHGLYLTAKGRAGVFLPQVATENGWDRLEFLDKLCLKAGLPPGTWKDANAQLYVFEGLVFGEKD